MLTHLARIAIGLQTTVWQTLASEHFRLDVHVTMTKRLSPACSISSHYSMGTNVPLSTFVRQALARGLHVASCKLHGTRTHTGAV